MKEGGKKGEKRETLRGRKREGRGNRKGEGCERGRRKKE